MNETNTRIEWSKLDLPFENLSEKTKIYKKLNKLPGYETLRQPQTYFIYKRVLSHFELYFKWTTLTHDQTKEPNQKTNQSTTVN